MIIHDNHSTLTGGGNFTTTDETTLFELLTHSGSALPHSKKRPTAAWLRKNARLVAEYSHDGEKRQPGGTVSPHHLSMNALVFDCGYGIYSSGGHTSVVRLEDCLDITYHFSFSTSGEKEGDRSTISRELLGNLPWYQAFILRGEAQITSAIERNLHGSGKSEDGSCENNRPCEDKPATAVHIPGPEEKFIRRETCEEIRSLLDLLPEDAAESFRLYHVYDMTVYEIADMLGISHQAVSKRIAKAQSALKEILRQAKELLGLDMGSM